MLTSRHKIARNMVLGIIMAAPGCFLLAQRETQRPPRAALLNGPQPIFSNDPHDSWNRIFYYLFSRRVEVRFTPDFPEGGPFRDSEAPLLSPQQVSTRIFERQETGDRPIDALYPNFLSDTGVRVVLSDPVYAEFREALQEAVQNNAHRSDAARAIMQNDLWSAYDIFSLYRNHAENGQDEFPERGEIVLRLVGRLIRKIALTPEAIRSLPDNYLAARKRYSLPDLFSGSSGWVEVQWFPERLHDRATGFRKVSRVFLKPARPPQDMQEFLNGLRDPRMEKATQLGGVALVIQPLVIDTHAKLTPTRISAELQVRLFEKTEDGAFQKTTIGVYELSRRQLLDQPQSGGLVSETESDPAYLPSAGNDYTFASEQLGNVGKATPLIVKLRTRCAACHGSSNLTNVMTFSQVVSPQEHLGPRVQRLNPAGHEAADFVVSQKARGDICKTLLSYFATGDNLAH
jgi:hypothetical protein